MKVILRTFLSITIALIVVMWVYGLFFASKQAVNKFDDRNWAIKAQARCLIAEVDRKALADYRIVNDLGATALAERAAIIDRATDTIEDFVKSFGSTFRTTQKGKRLYLFG